MITETDGKFSDLLAIVINEAEKSRNKRLQPYEMQDYMSARKKLIDYVNGCFINDAQSVRDAEDFLPPDVMFGDPITPDIVAAIVEKSALAGEQEIVVLGNGDYMLQNSAQSELPELMIVRATFLDKSGRGVGDSRENPNGQTINPDEMVVRIRFANESGVAALEQQLRFLRDDHFMVEPAGDHERINALQNESWKLEPFTISNGDDSDIGWRVVGFWMAEPQERTIAEVYEDDPRKAIDAAMREKGGK